VVTKSLKDDKCIRSNKISGYIFTISQPPLTPLERPQNNPGRQSSLPKDILLIDRSLLVSVGVLNLLINSACDDIPFHPERRSEAKGGGNGGRRRQRTSYRGFFSDASTFLSACLPGSVNTDIIFPVLTEVFESGPGKY
jgi:hypothetical protein